MRRNGEMADEYWKRLKRTDEILIEARRLKREGTLVRDILTNDFINYCMTKGLRYRDVSNIVGISIGSVGTFFKEWKATNNVADNHIPLIDFKAIIDTARETPMYTGVVTEAPFTDENVFLLISDIQAGTMVLDTRQDLDPVATVKDYFKQLKYKIGMTFTHRQMRVENFNIMLLGDLVEGWRIFKNQHTIDVRAQMRVCVEEIMSLMVWLRDYMPINNLHIYGAFGNHGRISHSHLTTDNFDQMVMDKIHEHIGIMKRYNDTFSNFHSHLTSDAPIQKHKIGKWKYLIGHGDHTRTDSSPTLEKYCNQAQNVFGRFDAFLFGHWHSAKWFSNSGIHMLCNGCMYPSPYSMYRIMKNPDIMQFMFGASDESAVAWVERLELKIPNGD